MTTFKLPRESWGCLYSVFHHLQSRHVKMREPIAQQRPFKVKEDIRIHAEYFKYSLEQSDLIDSSSRVMLI